MASISSSQQSECSEHNGSDLQYHSQETVLTEVMTITPQLAERYLKECVFPHQRPLREHKSTEYAEYMRKGEWTANTVIRFVVVRGGSGMFLVDGQHRLAAVIKAQRPQQFIVITEEVPTVDAAKQLYANLDIGMNRTVRDAVRVLDFADEIGVAESDVGYIDAAVKFIESDFKTLTGFAGRTSYAQRSRQMVVKRVTEWAIPAAKFQTAIAGHSGGRSAGRSRIARMLHSRPFLSVALVTTRYQPQKAAEFWGSVMANDGLRAGTPEHSAREVLIESIGASSSFKAEVKSRRMAACWNAYFDGRDVYDKIYARREDLPIRIAGTPFKG